MSTDNLEALNRFISIVLTRPAESQAGAASGPARMVPVVTIARDHGAGGEEVGRLVAEALGVGYYDKELLDDVVRHARANKTLMHHLDERAVGDDVTIMLARLWSGSEPEQEYRHCLAKAIFKIADVGGVIMGRGAHVVLADREILRVHLIGSPGACALRLAGGDRAKALVLRSAVRVTNRERGRFVWETFHSRTTDSTSFDLTINTDRFADLRGVADLVVQAFHHRFPAWKPTAKAAA